MRLLIQYLHLHRKSAVLLTVLRVVVRARVFPLPASGRSGAVRLRAMPDGLCRAGGDRLLPLPRAASGAGAAVQKRLPGAGRHARPPPISSSGTIRRRCARSGTTAPCGVPLGRRHERHARLLHTLGASDQDAHRRHAPAGGRGRRGGRASFSRSNSTWTCCFPIYVWRATSTTLYCAPAIWTPSCAPPAASTPASLSIRGCGWRYSRPGRQVLTDEKWFGFCVEQLLSNAVKYTPEGSISMYVEK